MTRSPDTELGLADDRDHAPDEDYRKENEYQDDLIISSKDAEAYVLGDDTKPIYSLGPDSERQPGTPRGKLTKGRHTGRSVYPGVERDYYVYVPAQYTPDKPAALAIFQDANLYLAPKANADIVLDNLINKGEIPVTVAVFIEAGEQGPGYPFFGGTDNRSIEYDSVNGDYARFLTEEFLPDALGDLNVSTVPRDRVLVGISSGGNCAFTAAWSRPDVFGNVISHCGSFINIRGGHNHPSAIRQNPRKPIRVWLQTGARDLDVIFGSIPIANQDMFAALEYRRYDAKFVYGEGGHSLIHGGAVLPETLRWIWRDHPDTADAQ